MAAFAAVATGFAAGPAGAYPPVVALRTGPLPAPIFAKPFHDRVIWHRSARARARAAQLSGPEHPYQSPDGETVMVAVSPAYPDPAQQAQLAQNAVNFLATRTHGTELALLHVFIAKPAQIHEQCGAVEAVACYFPAEQRMYVPGEPDPSGVPTEYVVTHEYGHHIATNRANSLADAFLTGPEYWATYEHVCYLSTTNPPQLFPGDQEAHYLQNPSEGWADSYAHLPEHYPNFPFQFSPLFIRDQGAFDAIHRDVAAPWKSQLLATYNGTGARRQTFVQSLALDGVVNARAKGRSGAHFTVAVRIAGTTVQKPTKGGVHGSLCAKPNDQRPINVVFRVVRTRGSGPYTLRVEHPG